MSAAGPPTPGADPDRAERSGGCPCGAVRFTCTGVPLNVRVCHCTDCQRVHAAPAVARALYPHERVRIDGTTGRFRTSRTLWRLFCPACGTRVMAWREPGGVAGVPLAGFDDPFPYPPTAHAFAASRPAWSVIGDGLRVYDGPAPAADDGSEP